MVRFLPTVIIAIPEKELDMPLTSNIFREQLTDHTRAGKYHGDSPATRNTDNASAYVMSIKLSVPSTPHSSALDKG